MTNIIAANMLTPLSPFGAVVEVQDGTPWSSLDATELRELVDTHKVLVIRGVTGVEKRTLPLLARGLGPIQAWNFGAVNVLKVDVDKENYLYTASDVPLHWDGAFKGEFPDLLVFHCLQAPPKDANGRTVFVDTESVWQNLDVTTQESFRNARFRYQTDKVVHYGGTFESPLVQAHPVSGETTLRFAEPVCGLNPVSVQALHDGAPSVDDVTAAIVDPTHRLCHTWQDGDVVIADNHALLHGREAFAEYAPRHIHRVNVLANTRFKWRWLVDSIRIRRPEFMVAEIPILLIGLLWAAPDAAWWASAIAWQMLAVFFLLFHFGDMVNCLADRELDAVYKTSLSEAVFGLGVRNVVTQIVVSGGVAVSMTIGLAIQTGRWWLVPLVVVGLALGHQYSYAPLRLKGRGLLQIPTLWALIFVGPMLLATGVVVGWPSPSLLLLIGLYGAMAQLIILVNTAEDFDEDVGNNIFTSAVALGRVRAVWASAAGVGVAGAGLFALFVNTVVTEASPGPLWFVLGLWTCGWSWATLEIGHLAFVVGRARDPDAALKRGAMKMPVWITVMAWLTLAVVGVRAWTL